MAAILVIGESGSGKSTSLRNLDPKTTLLIQVIKKDLPFRSKGWKPLTKLSDSEISGNIFVSRNTPAIVQMIARASSQGFTTVVIDDLQYLMSYELFDRVAETNFSKFVDIAVNVKTLFDTAREADVNVYFLAHSEQTEDGITRMKTSGKMLNNQLTPEGLFTIVLRCMASNGEHYFSTKTANDTVKTPMDMFKEDRVDNDLALVDKVISGYYKS